MSGMTVRFVSTAIFNNDELNQPSPASAQETRLVE
jgi:hypothetical protein